jgi:hypothetical protein
MSDVDAYFVLDGDDVVVHVSSALRDELATAIGHRLWVRMPGAEPILGPYLERARTSGEQTEGVGYYDGGTFEARIVPSGDFVTVYPRRLARLDVTTLATLRASLGAILQELAVRAPAPRDRPAPGSLRALP